MTYATGASCFRPRRIPECNGVEIMTWSAFTLCLAMCTIVTPTADVDLIAANIFSSVLVAGLLAFLFAAGLTVAGTLLNPAFAYGFFLCHLKTDAGAASRFFQYKLQALTGKRTFTDADHLSKLDALFTIVGEQVETLVVLLTHHTLSRQWCAAEIDTAVQKLVPMVVLRCLDFSCPTYDAHGKAQFDVICDFGSEGKELRKRGITQAMLQASFEAWLAIELFGYPLAYGR